MAMEFKDRSEGSDVLIQVVKQHIWDRSNLLYHVETGYETHIPEEARSYLRYVRNETARHIRFAPDFLVIERRNPDNVYFLEYKCTQTPLYSKNRIAEIAEKAGRESLDWQDNWPDIGQCEAEAYDNYMELNKIGVRVAILNYVAYHDRFLLCDFVDKVTELYRDQVRTPTQRGSRTPYINFDVTQMRTLLEFLGEEHGILGDSMTPYFEAMYSDLQGQLPTRHAVRSSLKKVTDLYLSGASRDAIIEQSTITTDEVDKHIDYLARIGVTPLESA